MKVILKTGKHRVNGVTNAKLYNSKEAAIKAGKAFMNEVTKVKAIAEGRFYSIIKA